MSLISTVPASRQRRNRQLGKVVLIVGFLAFLFGVSEAYRNPATGYELSILSATPTAFWVSIWLALLVGLVVAATQGASRLRLGALVLAGLSGLAVAGLPLLRGYHFYGGGDSLSHLGFARAFISGVETPLNLLHPGTHLVAILLESASGGSLEWAFMLMVVAFFLAFLVFVPMTVRAITGNPVGIVVGLFAAVLLLPINNVSVHPVPHPTSQAILFLPFILYLVVSYVTSSRGGRSLRSPIPVGGVLALASVAIVLLHPQQAANVILVFGTVVVLQFLARRLRDGHPFASQRSLAVQTVFLLGLFMFWAPRSTRTTNTVNSLIERLVGGAAIGDEVTGRGTSLAQLGGSFEELFLKLFLAMVVFGAIAGVFVLLSLSGRFEDRLPERNAFVKYFGLSMAPVAGVMLIYFLASATTQHFRYFGFLMAVATVLGAAALTVATEIDWQSTRTVVQVAVVVLFLVLTPLTMVALHPSPYMYQDSAQVSEAQMNGFATSFEVRDETIPYAGIRGGPQRYVHALLYADGIRAANDFPGIRSGVPEESFSNGTLMAVYDDPRYVAVTESDRKREVGLYQGFRYSQQGFQAMQTTPGIDRVVSNGEFDLYLLRGETA
ncbi:hypothetical protein [Halorarius litoreus]|uniref:hypothetical protein n=1 Tax=Halorarius litoreus TaxID=2962676 RepID=UPI0020CCE7CD|nr:hypothetical protein [Halorarius litoreus]